MISSKKPDPFFLSLLRIAENVRDSAHYANDFRINTVADLKEISQYLKNYETAGDTLIHELIVMLNKSFMTPIEREDILELAIRMDAILNGIDNFTAHLEMFSLIQIDESMRTFLGYIVKSIDEIVKAMELLASKKLLKMHEHSMLIKEYERKCDEVLRSSIKQLFLNEKDPIRIIKLKDIYEQLEEIADYCQNVANTLESIIMRNA